MTPRGIWLMATGRPSSSHLEGLADSDTDIVAVSTTGSCSAPALQLRVVTIFGDVDIHPVPVTSAAV